MIFKDLFKAVVCLNFFLPLFVYLGVADLPFTTHEHTLQKEFSAFGEVAEGVCHFSLSYLLIFNELGSFYLFICDSLACFRVC